MCTHLLAHAQITHIVCCDRGLKAAVREVLTLNDGVLISFISFTFYFLKNI